jgi:hypothetical protein
MLKKKPKPRKAFRRHSLRAHGAKRRRAIISGASTRKLREHRRMMAVINRIMDEDRDFLRDLARQ